MRLVFESGTDVAWRNWFLAIYGLKIRSMSAVTKKQDYGVPENRKILHQQLENTQDKLPEHQIDAAHALLAGLSEEKVDQMDRDVFRQVDSTLGPSLVYETLRRRHEPQAPKDHQNMAEMRARLEQWDTQHSLRRFRRMASSPRRSLEKVGKVEAIFHEKDAEILFQPSYVSEFKPSSGFAEHKLIIHDGKVAVTATESSGGFSGTSMELDELDIPTLTHFLKTVSQGSLVPRTEEQKEAMFTATNCLKQALYKAKQEVLSTKAHRKAVGDYVATLKSAKGPMCWLDEDQGQLAPRRDQAQPTDRLTPQECASLSTWFSPGITSFLPQMLPGAFCLGHGVLEGKSFGIRRTLGGQGKVQIRRVLQYGLNHVKAAPAAAKPFWIALVTQLAALVRKSVLTPEIRSALDAAATNFHEQRSDAQLFGRALAEIVIGALTTTVNPTPWLSTFRTLPMEAREALSPFLLDEMQNAELSSSVFRDCAEILLEPQMQKDPLGAIIELVQSVGLALDADEGSYFDLMTSVTPDMGWKAWWHRMKERLERLDLDTQVAIGQEVKSEFAPEFRFPASVRKGAHQWIEETLEQLAASHPPPRLSPEE